MNNNTIKTLGLTAATMTALSLSTGTVHAEGLTAADNSVNDAANATTTAVSETAENTSAVSASPSTKEEAKSALDQAKTAEAEAQKNADSAQADVDQAQNAVDSASHDAEAAKTAADNTKNTLSNAVDQVKSDAKNAFETAEENQTAANEQLSNATSEAEKANQELEDAKNTQQAAQDAYDQEAAKFPDASDQINEADTSLSSAEKAVNDATVQRDEANENVANAANNLTEKETALAEAETNADRLKTQINDAVSEKDALERDLSNKKTELEDLETDSNHLANEIADAKSDLDAANAAVTAEEAAWSKTKSDAQKSLEEAQAALQESGLHFLEEKTGKNLDTAISYIKSSCPAIFDGGTNEAEFYKVLATAFSEENINRSLEFFDEINGFRRNAANDPVDKTMLKNSSSLAELKFNLNTYFYSAIVGAVDNFYSGHYLSDSDASTPLNSYLETGMFTENVCNFYKNPNDFWYRTERERYINGERDYSKIGHYKNLLNETQDSGSVACITLTGGYPMYVFNGCYSPMAPNAVTVTTSEFRSAYASYVKDLKNTSEKASAVINGAEPKALSDAKTAQTEAQNKYDSLVNTDIASEISSLQNQITTLENKISEHEKNIAALKEAKASADA